MGNTQLDVQSLINMGESELQKLFDCLNNEYYNNELPKVQITFEDANITTFGMYYAESNKIVITYLCVKKGYLQIIDTLHHEMIHLYCNVNNIEDTYGRYHNENFKNECRKRGFTFDSRPLVNIGWSKARLKKKTIKLIDTWDIDVELFNQLKDVVKMDVNKHLSKMFG